MKQKKQAPIECRPGSGDDSDNESEGQALEAGRQARRAADERIAKLLSGDSTAYVTDSVQHGGE